MPIHDHPQMLVLNRVLCGKALMNLYTLPYDRLKIQQAYPWNLLKNE